MNILFKGHAGLYILHHTTTTTTTTTDSVRTKGNRQLNHPSEVMHPHRSTLLYSTSNEFHLHYFIDG
ncbi:hypothetical protein QWZ08_24730 [Ferruginibacter paludis]|nr:hypothetical protein [Ferruginibacter paludis]